MTRPANQPVEQIQQTPTVPANMADPLVPVQEPKSLSRIPLPWRIVLVVWAVCLCNLVQYEIIHLVAPLPLLWRILAIVGNVVFVLAMLYSLLVIVGYIRWGGSRVPGRRPA